MHSLHRTESQASLCPEHLPSGEDSLSFTHLEECMPSANCQAPVVWPAGHLQPSAHQADTVGPTFVPISYFFNCSLEKSPWALHDQARSAPWAFQSAVWLVWAVTTHSPAMWTSWEDGWPWETPRETWMNVGWWQENGGDKFGVLLESKAAGRPSLWEDLPWGSKGQII